MQSEQATVGEILRFVYRQWWQPSWPARTSVEPFERLAKFTAHHQPVRVFTLVAKTKPLRARIDRDSPLDIILETMKEDIFSHTITCRLPLVELQIVHFHLGHQAFVRIVIRQITKKHLILAVPRLSAAAQVFRPEEPHALQKDLALAIEADPQYFGDERQLLVGFQQRAIADVVFDAIFGEDVGLAYLGRLRRRGLPRVPFIPSLLRHDRSGP